MDIEKVIREYLAGLFHMSLATSSNGQPWVCEVHFATDENLNIYFRSLESRRHSQEIAQNPKVAGNMVEQHGLEDKPRGVYFEGSAQKLADVNENHPAYLAIHERLGVGTEILEDASRDGGHKFYKITVANFYLFDARESSPSQKYQLPWGK